MRIFLAILFIASITAAAHAKEVFKDKELRDIRVVETQGGKAFIQDKTGTKAEVSINDHIGRGQGKVVEIEKAYIAVETDTGRTRLPITHGFERR